jgi:hypothetical protein
MYGLHLQGRKIRERGTSVSTWQPPKRRFTQDLHGATSQKTAFFVQKVTNVSDNPFACIFFLKMETIGSSETLVPLYQNTRIHIPEDFNLKIS